MGKVVFFHCTYIQCNIPPINTQLTAFYLCPVLLRTAITVYLARSKMQSNNVICSLPLIARIYLQIRGAYKYKRLHCLFTHGVFFSLLQVIFEILFLLITRNQNLMGSLPCVWALCHCLWHDSCTKWSSAQSFFSVLIFAKIQAWHLQSGPTSGSQLQGACPWDASLFQSHLHPTTFAMSSSEMLPLVWDTELLSVCRCSGTPHTGRGQPWGHSPHGELDKCFMLHRTWGCAMPRADVAFSSCLGSSKYIFVGRTLLSQGLERRCSPSTLLSGAARWRHRAGMAPGSLSLNSSPCVCSRPWPWPTVPIYRGKNKKCWEQTAAFGWRSQTGLSHHFQIQSLTPRRLGWLRCKCSFDSRLSKGFFSEVKGWRQGNSWTCY